PPTPSPTGALALSLRSLPAALPISSADGKDLVEAPPRGAARRLDPQDLGQGGRHVVDRDVAPIRTGAYARPHEDHRHVHVEPEQDRKSTRLNSSHERNTYSVFCLKT